MTTDERHAIETLREEVSNMRSDIRMMTEKVDDLLNGKTANCTTHAMRIGNCEAQIGSLWKVVGVVAVAIVGGMIKLIFFT